MADNFPLTPGSGRSAATDQVTYSGDTADVQLVRPVLVTGAEGAKTVVDLPGDATNGLDVDVTRLPALVAGSANIGDVDVASIAAGDNNIGNVDIVSVPAPLSTTGGGTEATAHRVTIANDSTGVLSVDDNGASLTVDAPLGTPVHVRLSDGTDVGLISAGGAALVDIASAIPAGTNNIGDVDVLSLPAIPAGTNNIGDVDVLTLPAIPAGTNNIGDVDVLTIAAGTNQIGDVGVKPRTSGGLTKFHLVAAGSTNATNIKASAGQVYGWYIFNNAASMRKVAFHNASGTPTAGASIYFSLCLPAGSAANVFSETGIAFSTGIAITTVTGIADSDATAVTANDLSIVILYN
jgi:hypothetical protein